MTINPNLEVGGQDAEAWAARAVTASAGTRVSDHDANAGDPRPTGAPESVTEPGSTHTTWPNGSKARRPVGCPGAVCVG